MFNERKYLLHNKRTPKSSVGGAHFMKSVGKMGSKTRAEPGISKLKYILILIEFYTHDSVYINVYSLINST